MFVCARSYSLVCGISLSPQHQQHTICASLGATLGSMQSGEPDKADGDDESWLYMVVSHSKSKEIYILI